MKASLKVHMYTSKLYTDNTHPIVLQYIIDGRVKKKVIARCKSDNWNFKTNRVKTNVTNAARINSYISTEYAKAEKELYDLKSGDLRISDIFSEKRRLTLGEAIELELERLKAEFKSGYYDKISALKKQVKTGVLLSDIDEKWFDNLISNYVSKGNKNNTIIMKIKQLRGIILRYSDKGVTREIKQVKVASEKTIKLKLTSVELKALEELKLPDDDLLTATRDIFLMQVYLRGIRVGDLLQAEAKQFEDGRFMYTADKTGKGLTIKLIPRAQEILDKYSGKHDKLFPFFTWRPNKKLSKFENERARLKHKEVCTTAVNKNLKVLAVMAGIKKPLSSHIAKHTFARMAIDKINNPMVTMELLGHSTLAVHQIYLNDIRQDDVLDKAADDIFGD